MKKLVTLLILGLAVPFSPASIAQTPKTHTHKDMQGKTIEYPYISYSEFEDISIDGRGRMGELLTVRSVEQAVRILGEPKERKITEINSGGYKTRTQLLYDGLRVSYLEAAGDVHLEVVEVTSSERFLAIGGRKVHPGVPQNKLGKPLRKELSRTKAEEKTDRLSTTIFIERKEGKKSKRGKRVLEYSEIRVEVDVESSEVSSVVFSRII